MDVIGYAVWALGLRLEQAKDLTYAEFKLLDYRYTQERLFAMRLTREIAYQSYCSSFALSKKKPKRKTEFWPIATPKAAGPIGAKHLKAYQEALAQYNKAKNG